MTTPFANWNPTDTRMVLIDIDAPLALWEEGLVEECRRLFPNVYTADAGTRLEWDLTIGLDSEQKAAVFHIMHMPGFYRNLRPVPGSVDALHAMLNDNIDVMLLSTPSLDNPTCASDKLAWIQEHYGREIAERTILSLDKTVVLGHALIDDKPIIKGRMKTPVWKHIVFDRAYNQNAPGPRLYNWADCPAVLAEALDQNLAAA